MIASVVAPPILSAVKASSSRLCRPEARTTEARLSGKAGLRPADLNAQGQTAARSMR